MCHRRNHNLTNLSSTVRNGDVGNPYGDDCLCFLSPEDAAKINSASATCCAPISPIMPFYGWSIKEVYDFWLMMHVRPPMDEKSGCWTSFTFLILDDKSVKDRKCILCCDAPDICEKGDEVIVKSGRLLFGEAAINMVSFEMPAPALSEMNKKAYISVMQSAWANTTGFPSGGLTGKAATPEYAGAKKVGALAGRG